MNEKQILGDPKERLVEVFKGNPVDRTARLVTSIGVSWAPEIRRSWLQRFNTTANPLPFKPHARSGEKCGRFTVLGELNVSRSGNRGNISQSQKRKALLVVRCCCGRYEVRKHKELSTWEGHMCLKCVARETTKRGLFPKFRQRLTIRLDEPDHLRQSHVQPGK